MENSGAARGAYLLGLRLPRLRKTRHFQTFLPFATQVVKRFGGKSGSVFRVTLPKLGGVVDVVADGQFD